MLKIALIIIVTSASSNQPIEELSIVSFYENMELCQDQLNSIKLNLNAKEYKDKKNTRYLVLENRQKYQEGNIYWTCQNKKS